MTADEPRVAPASDYDTFVNWDARLKRELPLFRRVFDEAGAASVIDVGAGSAKHSIAFAQWGLSVDAVDPDDSMLAQAEVNAAAAAQSIAEAGGELRLVRAGFGELAARGLGPADALVCTGNALPHVAGLAGLRAALADFLAVLRPGGVLVLHLLNHAKLLRTRPRSIPPIVREEPDGTRVFLRVIDYPQGDEFLDFDFVTLTRDSCGVWDVTSRRSPHTALPVELLRAELAAAGFERIEAFGSHDGTPLDADKDESVIVVARTASVAE
jgi:SAM-dependent methyltransferase